MAPDRLSGMLEGLPRVDSPDLLVGMDTMDDAGVFRLSDEMALVQTVDVFAPAVNDARTSGRIVAANCLSDIWAMGGRPVTVMNILGFPSSKIPREVIAELLGGAAEKFVECGVVLVGGHTVDQKEIMFGMSVTGLIHPALALRVSCAREGDLLVLTKPVGSGVLTTALKDGRIGDGELGEAVRSMERLNMYACDALRAFSPSAMTDVTGFGLAGHAASMARSSGVTIEIGAETVPLLGHAREVIGDYLPGGSGRNWESFEAAVEVAPGLDETLVALACDSQTSGGLLAAIRPEDADEALVKLREAGDTASAVVGRVTAFSGRPVRLV